MFPIGLGLSVFVLVILVLLVFTDLELPSEPRPPQSNEHRVHGIELRSAPVRDAAAD